MKLIRPNAKLVSVFLIILMLSVAVPFDSVLAAMVETEATLHSTRAQQARDEINSLLLREDVQNALMAQGIDLLEAQARIDNLSDAEVIQIADEIDKLPAAGAFFSPSFYILIVAVMVAIIAVIVTGLVYLAKYTNEMGNSPNSEKSDSPEQYHKPAGTPHFNPDEPWTGVWDVQGSGHFSGRWRIIQTGSNVSSTKDSYYEIKGKAKGNQLKGRISSTTPSGQFNSFVINISPDGLSFEGTCDLSWQKNLPMKGRREQ